MHSPSTQQHGRWCRRRFTGLLLALTCALAGHVWLASQRAPVPSATGQALQWPAQILGQRLGKALRVATYNIRRGKGSDGRRDLARVAGVLEGMDVVGLNELAGPTWLGQADQAEQLGRRLGLGWLFAPNQRRWYRDHFGNGLLSRFPVSCWRNEQLFFDRDASRSFRNLLVADLQQGGQCVPLFVTHLDWKEIRQDQLRQVLSRFREQDLAVLVGDLNTEPDDPLLRELFEDPNNLDAIHAALGDQDVPDRVDWIITRGFRVLRGGLVPVGVSDHPCYWVDLEPMATGQPSKSMP